ncbi:hypothetical protein ACLKA6_004899 [Drosophila palustris]
MRTSFTERGRSARTLAIVPLKCLRRDKINVAAQTRPRHYYTVTGRLSRLSDSLLDSDSWFIKRIMPQDTLKLPATTILGSSSSNSNSSCCTCCWKPLKMWQLRPRTLPLALAMNTWPRTISHVL